MDARRFPPDLVDAVLEVSNLLLSESDLDTTLDHVAAVGSRILPGCDGAGISVETEAGKTHTFGKTDQWVLEIDNSQYVAGEGPCLQAIRDGEVHEIVDLRTDDRWPVFKAAALEAGLRASYSIPLSVRDKTIGALNLYSRSEGPFPEGAKAAVEVVAAQGAIALANAQTLQATKRLVEQLEVAIESRETIGAALGIVMERENVSEQEAFEMLKSASQNTNVKLREVAKMIIDQKKKDLRSS